MNAENCLICLEPITNPVCVTCYLKELYAWMQGLRIKEVPRSVIMGIIKRKLDLDCNNQTKCIFCKKENITLCSYCFFSISERILKELNFSEELIENFNEIFNYHLTEELETERLNNIKEFWIN